MEDDKMTDKQIKLKPEKKWTPEFLNTTTIVFNSIQYKILSQKHFKIKILSEKIVVKKVYVSDIFFLSYIISSKFFI